MIYPPSECPRYDRCSVNLCPLDPEMESRTVHEEDKEQKCPMEKRVRLRIGSKYPDLLPLGGLTAREHSAKARWDSMSPAEKANRIAKAKHHLFGRNPQTGQNP